MNLSVFVGDNEVYRGQDLRYALGVAKMYHRDYPDRHVRIIGVGHSDHPDAVKNLTIIKNPIN